MESLWEEERAKQVEEHLNKLAQEASLSELTPQEHAQRSRAARIALNTIPKTNPTYNKKHPIKKKTDLHDEDDEFAGYIGNKSLLLSGNKKKSNINVEKEKRTREETRKMASEMKVINKSKDRELDDFLKDMAMEVSHYIFIVYMYIDICFDFDLDFDFFYSYIVREIQKWDVISPFFFCLFCLFLHSMLI